MQIRRAALEDVPQINQCCTESFQDYIPIIGQTPGPMLEDYREGVLKHHMFVAVQGEDVLGFILLKDDQGDHMWLDVLAVSPRAANQGVGKALIAWGEEWIRSQGKGECRLYTHVAYTKPQGMYLRGGYEIYDRVLEKGYDRYYMKKNL